VSEKDLNETTEMWRGWKKESQDRRANNRENSAQLLRDAGVPFEEKNLGCHLVVQTPQGTVDFWPGTGLWQFRAGIRGRGVHQLLRIIRRAS
jgi:hypothetical protein